MAKRNKKANAEIQKAMDGQAKAKKEKKTRKVEKKEKKEKVVKVKEPKVTHVDINCSDCGAVRNIKIQDRFQVKRCVECQDIFRKEQRKEYRKNRIKNLQTRIDELEVQNAELQEMLDKVARNKK